MAVRNLDALNLLNALRNPKAWKRLKDARVTEPFTGSIRQRIERTARATGLGIEWSDSMKEEDRRRLEIQGSDGPCGGRASPLDLFRRFSSPYVILEPDRIRVLSISEALEFWTSWWEVEGRR